MDQSKVVGTHGRVCGEEVLVARPVEVTSCGKMTFESSRGV